MGRIECGSVGRGKDERVGRWEGKIFLFINYTMEIIKSHRELRVYQKSFEVAMEIFKLTKSFPKEELYSLTDQIPR